MNIFLEIKTINDKIALINMSYVSSIHEGIEVDYNFIIMNNRDIYKTYESIESIKERLK